MDINGSGSSSCSKRSSAAANANCMMMMGFGDNSGGLSSMTKMINSAQETNNNSKTFFGSAWSWTNNNNNNTAVVTAASLMPQNYSHVGSSSTTVGATEENINMRAKIMTHPLFPRLLSAYVNCQNVGAPPEVVARLEASERGMERSRTSCIGEDPALDQFMEAYCEMLAKYEQELTKPLKEAMAFISGVECQLKALTLESGSGSLFGEIRSSGENIDAFGSNTDNVAEDNDLKCQLLRKYSGYLGSLKQEFSKKKKKGKLPKEARQKLLDWWSRHYKWPYPSETQKLALAQSTGLDQKQINNWFINQRKRHWKPSEDQFAVMDTIHPHIYMEGVMNNPYPMDCMPMLL